MFSLWKKKKETLHNNARRYWEEINELEENVYSKQMTIMSFKHSLHPESKLKQLLTKSPTTTLKDL